MKNRFLKWTVRVGALAATLAIVGAVVFWQVVLGGTQPPTEAENEPEGKATVTTVEVMQGSVVPTALAYGTVASSPGKTQVLLVQHDGVFKTVNIRDGEIVRAGTPLVTISATVANAAAFEQAKSALDFAKTDYDQVQRRFANKLATNDDVATKRKALSDAQLAYDQQVRLGAGATEETIRAPFDGVINGLMAVAGDKVQANTGFGTISSQTDVTVQLMLEPEDAAKVRPGAKVRLNLPLQGDEEMGGKLTSVTGVVDKDSHLVKAFADIPAAGSAHLALGTSLVARIDLPPRQGLVVPRTALLEDETGPFIFTISDEDEAKKQNIKVLVETEDQALIDGFDPALGTRVVIMGNTELDDDTPVEETKQ
jgi:RND family efflux transporter MFP subunit